jgi:hypothetical protein
MYGVTPPHSILEDSRYLRNALGTRTTTYWIPNTWEYLSALLRTSAPEDAHRYLQYAELVGEIVTSQGLELYAGLSLSSMEATVRNMGQGYLHSPYM